MIQAAIVGTGKTSKRYAQHLLKAGQAEIFGIYDDDEVNAQELAAEYGCRAFSSFERLMEALPTGSVLVVAEPEDSDKHSILQALKSGYHVIAGMQGYRLGDIQELLASVSSSSGGRLLFANPERFYYHNRDLKKRIEDGAIGSLGMINSKRYCPLIPDDDVGVPIIDGGAALNRLALKEIDLLRWIAGEVDTVYAMRASIRPLDYVLVTLQFRSGVIANLEAYSGYPGAYTSAVEYAGSKGVIRYDNRKTNAFHVHRRADSDVNPGTRGFSPSFRNPEYDNLVHMLDCLDKDKEPAMTVEDAFETMRVVAAASQSLHTGQPVNLFSEGVGNDA
ncbi:gfo/Idh/MocA family oxidoreductase [Paenibacillus sp. H1-7]|uniref:Gfo/Idh/MocA family protein n=1 Tax=Paenibacillus sp. H1-7 TaxID=2282849 RepID=UPI001EF81AB9|nr:Gfo/Idh/MocA family oxidoreductase [Paenibacillus sp. H1-7]ULL16707.1 gfo/Idh/MocA family oxidoreductase [Paenibacillus sp. H1-7]